MHRGRRKRQEARRRLESKKDFIRSEIARLEEEAELKRAAQRLKDKKNSSLGPALALMKDMAEALPELEDDGGAERKKGDQREMRPKVLRHKARKKMVAEEMEQVRNVRAHPVFKDDPMEALRQHLVNSIGTDPAEVAPPVQEGKQEKRTRRKRGKADGRVLQEVKGEGDEDMRKARGEAKTRVVEKREQKAVMAAAAAKLKRKKGGKIEKQTLSGSISKWRGRIGVKRPKI